MQDTHNFMFTVFTPTYNRAHTLDRVFSSLRKQRFTSFEWLIIDDGSTDDTAERVKRWQQEDCFKIRYRWQTNSGKHVAINRAAVLAKGEFILIADSDDSFEWNTLEIFYRHWRELPDHEKQICAGVTCLAKDGYTNRIVGKPHKFTNPRLTYEMQYNHKEKRTFEAWGIIRRDILRQFPFPEIKGVKFIPEGYVWNSIYRNYPRVLTNHVLRTIYHQNDGFSINTQTNYVRHANGFYLYFLSNVIQNADIIWRYNPWRLFKDVIQLQRIGMHSPFKLKETWEVVRKIRIAARIFWVSLVAAYILAMVDRLKVKREEYTSADF